MTADPQPVTFQKAALCQMAVNPDAPICKPDSPALAAHGNACEGHYARVEKLLAECWQARRLMLQSLTPGSSGQGERVSGSGDRQDALRVSALDLADRLSDWLAVTPDWLVTQPNARELADSLAQTLNEAHAICPWRTGRQHLPVQCPHCWSRTLYRDDGKDHAYCKRSMGGCGKNISEVELGHLEEQHMSEVAWQLEQAAAERDRKASA